jgi:hypothetical protein
MRIVGLDEFLALPNETLFCKYYGTLDWGELRVKTGLAADSDFMFQNVLEVRAEDTSERMMLENTAIVSRSCFRLNLNCPQRDRMRVPKARFVIFEKDDVKAIMDRLKPVMKAFGG